MKNCVIITLKKDEIVMKINEESEQREIIQCLEEKLPDLKKLYKDDKTSIYVAGKVLNSKEIYEIKETIQKQIPVQINFESSKDLGLHGIKKSFSKEIASSETIFHKGSLRSGQKIEYEGSIVIIGDVNGGAEVIAGENIIVVGILRGLAHAGAKGNKQAIIAAQRIECPQIRISNIIKEITQDEENEEIQNFAYVNEKDEIIFQN